MVALQTTTRLPAWYLTHGGGPMPLMGDTQHAAIVSQWKSLAATLPAKPKVILLISGHWEEKVPTVTNSTSPPMLYDYYGFPPEAYKIRYDAPGHPQLAREVSQLLQKHGFKATEDSHRGFDHGAFVPLKVIFPKADIPVVMLSLLSSLNAKVMRIAFQQEHVEMGEAIAPLRDEGVLVIGSGSSYHNMQGFNRDGGAASAQSQEFDTWLQDSLSGEGHSPTTRKQTLINWDKAPSSRFCHPREEHLLPLHVAFGSARGSKAKTIFTGNLFGAAISSYEWDE